MSKPRPSDADLVAEIRSFLLADRTASANRIVRETRHERKRVLAIVRELRGQDAASSVDTAARWFVFIPGRSSE